MIPTLSPSFEKWCETGFDHRQHILNERVRFERRRTLETWYIDFETLDDFAMFFHKFGVGMETVTDADDVDTLAIAV